MKDFICECGRKQSYAPPDKSGGITEEEAEFIGWRRINNKWKCPYCSGNLENLNRCFFGEFNSKPGYTSEEDL